jgi:CPA1 family monovalent cation:H+ antiporter
LEEALKHIKARREANESHHLAAALDDAVTKYKRRLSAVTGQSYEQHGIDAEDHGHIVDLGRQLVQIERETAVRLRNEGMISDQVLRQLEYELDLSETRLGPITPD